MRPADEAPHRGLLGRRREMTVLDDLLAGVEGGRSASMVLHGEAGIGKSALLAYTRSAAKGWTVVRASGAEAEAELAFSGLHQVCTPLLDGLDRLAEPQRLALQVAFGLTAGSPPDRFLVGLAVLSLLANAAEQRPVACLVDDAQWLDDISAQTLAFVARRLLAERVLLLFAVRGQVDRHPLRGLPQLAVEGLQDDDARALMATVTARTFDPRVRDRILAEAHGNPLAILELPKALTTPELAGGRRDGDALTGKIEQGYLARIRALTAETQRYLLIAAAEPVGDLALQRRAAERLGVDLDTATREAEVADLVSARSLVRFRHPLVRSATYRGAAPDERREVHRVLAEVTEAHHPERRAWHRANSLTAPDESVAAELERAAEHARARGGVGAAGAFLARAVQLTPDPARRGQRAVAAARAKCRAGAFSEATELLDEARLTPLTPHDRAVADIVRGEVTAASHSAGAGLPLLLSAAKQLEPLDPLLARETYRDAMYAAFTSGSLPGGEYVDDVASAILTMPPVHGSSRETTLLEGTARVYTEGYAVGVPLLQRAIADYRAAEASPIDIPWLPLAARMAHNVWDLEGFAELSVAMVEQARRSGVLSLLPSALLLDLSARAFAGDLTAAQERADEAKTIGDVIGSAFFGRYGALVVAGWRSDEAAVRSAAAAIVDDPDLGSEGKALTGTEWAAAVVANGLGRFEDAYAAALRGSAHPQELGLAIWSSVELVEAAARLDRTADPAVVAAAARLEEMTAASATDWARGTWAYVAALLTPGAAAERSYLDAIDALDRTGARIHRARARLVYGEWLVGSGRAAEAHGLLREAHEQLAGIGVVAYAERARRALVASGADSHALPAATRGTGDSLTAQESQIARLAAAGMTNPEIGAQLYLSAHTVEWHLRKVFAKLGVRSRRDVGAALAR
jgi:DNA-binding CsgD family transcriptional regulator